MILSETDLKTIEELLVHRIKNREKMSQLVADINETLERLKEKHPMYSAILSLEKMRDDIKLAHSDVEKMIELMGIEI